MLKKLKSYNNKIPIYFYIDEQILNKKRILDRMEYPPINELPKNITEFKKWFNNFQGSWGSYCWILQTYLRLKEEGLKCKLTNKLPEKGIVFFHRDSFPDHLKKNNQLLLICTISDKEEHPLADINITQNPQTISQNEYFIPLWPQIGIIPRDINRDKLENVIFYGMPENLAEELKDISFNKKIEDMDFKWEIISDKRRWKDYSKVDVILAVRSFDKKNYINKPATKMYNAWIAGVPAIFGPESAYQAERKNNLDYIEVNSIDEIILVLAKLKKDIKFRKAIVKNGLERAEEITTTKIIEKWMDFIKEVAIPHYHKLNK